MFPPLKVVAFLFACVTGKTGFGDLFRRLVFERDDLCRVAFFEVGLARSMTRFTACYFVFPTADLRKTCV
jgi:hypothetical protein